MPSAGLLRGGKVEKKDPMIEKALKYIEDQIDPKSGHIVGVKNSSAYALSHSRKSLSRCSPPVRISRSTSGAGRSQRGCRWRSSSACVCGAPDAARAIAEAGAFARGLVGKHLVAACLGGEPEPVSLALRRSRGPEGAAAPPSPPS